MFYCVEDSDGDIAFCSLDKNDPEIQEFMDKYEYFDPMLIGYRDIWEVRIKEPDSDYTLWSIHADESEAQDKIKNINPGFEPYVHKV